MATDNGYPVSHSGSAMVRVSVTNVNDEDPVFMQSVEHILVSEDAMPNTVIHVVQAHDPDGDDVTFSFTGKIITLVIFSSTFCNISFQLLACIVFLLVFCCLLMPSLHRRHGQDKKDCLVSSCRWCEQSWRQSPTVFSSPQYIGD